jgi:aldehyde dehydrogenase (NAD+)
MSSVRNHHSLSAGVWMDKGSKIFKMVNKLRADVVRAYTCNKFDPTRPFGGYNESGFGREGVLQGGLKENCTHKWAFK